MLTVRTIMAKKIKSVTSDQQEARIERLQREAAENYQKELAKQQQVDAFERQRQQRQSSPQAPYRQGQSLTEAPESSFLRGRPAFAELLSGVPKETAESMARLRSPIESLLMQQLEAMQQQRQRRSPLERLYESMGINPDMIQELQADPESSFGDYIAPLAGAATQNYLAPLLSQLLLGNRQQSSQPNMGLTSVTRNFGLGRDLAQAQAQDLQQPGGYYGSQASEDMQNIRDNFRPY